MKISNRIPVNARFWYFKVITDGTQGQGKKCFEVVNNHFLKKTVNFPFFIQEETDEYKDVFYAFWTEEEATTFYSSVSMNNISISMEDRTHKLMDGSFYNEPHFFLSFTEADARKRLKDFLGNTLTIDALLDRILDVGLQRLQPFELELLEELREKEFANY